MLETLPKLFASLWNSCDRILPSLFVSTCVFTARARMASSCQFTPSDLSVSAR